MHNSAVKVDGLAAFVIVSPFHYQRFEAAVVLLSSAQIRTLSGTYPFSAQPITHA